MPTSKNITKLGREVRLAKFGTGKWGFIDKNDKVREITTQQAKDRGFINPAKRKPTGLAMGLGLGMQSNWKKRLGL